MKRHLILAALGGGLAVATLAPACGGPDTNDTSSTSTGTGGAGGAGSDEVAELARDVRGVPHIRAKTMRAALHALGYATAQDRLYQLVATRLLMRGRSAEHFGLEEVGPSTERAPPPASLYWRAHRS